MICNVPDFFFRPLSLGRIFTVNPIPLTNGGLDYSNIQDLIDLSGISNASFEQVSNANAMVFAAIERSAVAPPAPPVPEFGIKNELNMFQNLLMNYKGITFRSLMSKMITSPGWQSQNPEENQEDYLTEQMQISIFNSILSSDQEKEFVDQVEEQYKDFFFFKNSLGQLYSTVKSLMTMGKTMSKTINNLSDLTYRDRILKGTNMRDRLKMKEEIFKDVSNSPTNANFQAYKLEVGKGLVPIIGKQRASIVFYKPDKELPIGLKVANNVKVVQGASSRARSASTATGINQNARTRNVGNTRGGGY